MIKKHKRYLNIYIFVFMLVDFESTKISCSKLKELCFGRYVLTVRIAQVFSVST